MLKNITLSAEEILIERARQRANAEGSTLNAEFRRWLEEYTERPQNVSEFETLMQHLSYVQPGKVFTRKELNER